MNATEKYIGHIHNNFIAKGFWSSYQREMQLVEYGICVGCNNKINVSVIEGKKRFDWMAYVPMCVIFINEFLPHVIIK